MNSQGGEGILDEPGKTDVLPVFSLMVGEVMNVIGDFIGTADGLLKYSRSLIAGEILQKGTADNVLQKHNAGTRAKNDETEGVIVSGNVFAKMIDMGDNLEDHENFSTGTEGLIQWRVIPE
jgi:hypothetical protein